MSKWTEDTTYKFVQEYLKHDCLYNCKDPKYKIKGAREAALLQISEAMNIPGFGSKEAYTKIRNLRSTYSQEVKKVKQSTKSGAGTDDLYIPQIKWFKLLDEALSAVNVQCRDSQSNMELDSQHEVLDRENPSTSQHNQYAEKNDPNATLEPQRNNNEERKSPIPRKRAIRDLNRLVNKVKNVADTINIPATQTETEFDIFGKSVAAQLQSMPLQIAIQGQMYIQNYLSNLRLQQMGHGIPISSSPSTSYTMSPPPLQNFPSSPYTEPPPTSPYTQQQPTSPYTQQQPTSPYTQQPSTSPYTEPPPTSPNIQPPLTSPYTQQTPLTSPYTQQPSTSHTQPPQTSHTDNTDNIPPADQSGNHSTQTFRYNDSTITLYSRNNESKTVPATQDDILALAVASLYK